MSKTGAGRKTAKNSLEFSTGLDVSGKVEVLNAAYREKLRCLNQCVNDNDAIGWHGAIEDRSVQ